ncbi:MAG TPA: DUF2891 domain-containing protein [Casimicrobiaceae bacterium]|nr:DUF2891 domain-containing protein [Casimicrobiaceae bacterium]
MSTESLAAETAESYARIALANVVRAYPCQPQHVWTSDGDTRTPRELHPAFYGSFDWHSSVHMHWTLARLRRAFSALPSRAAIDTIFDAHLAPAPIAAECAYFARPGTGTFERTYGWAWLLALAGELAGAARDGDAAAARGSAALAPLTSAIAARFSDFLPRAGYPVRHGTHANSAFALALAFDYANACGDGDLRALVVATALEWFGDDRDAPIAWEPSGVDFLSPALMEAALMQRVLAAAAFTRWFAAFLPDIAAGDGASRLAPVHVTDRADGQIVHLDGLNLSRAWCLAALARGLAADPARAAALAAAAARHRSAGLAGIDSDAYVGRHWLVTFAVLATLAAAPA